MNGRQLLGLLEKHIDLDNEIGTCIIVNDGTGKLVLKYMPVVGVNMEGPKVRIEGKTIINFTEGFSSSMVDVYEGKIKKLEDELNTLKTNINKALNLKGDYYESKKKKKF